MSSLDAIQCEYDEKFCEEIMQLKLLVKVYARYDPIRIHSHFKVKWNDGLCFIILF